MGGKKGAKSEPESPVSSTVLSGGQFSVSTRGSGPETSVPRIDLTISDDEDNDDTTPFAGHTKTKLEPKTTDLTLSVKVKAEPMFVDLTISDPDDHCPSRKHPCSISSDSSHAASDEDDVEHTWPTDFHVVDVVKGFDRCLKASKAHKSVEEAFFKCFGVPFKSSTFYWHRRKWKRASEAC